MHFSRGECLLQYWLDKRKLSQVEFGRRSGWSQRMISHWCNDERKMSVEAMYTAATILEIRMDQLYRWRLEANDSRPRLK
ncbi:helix-turn-helix domain-containing protein [Paenibacillus sp. MMO-58]|uniref:helix-turn-helix domain-containing protein n=1 Tax=Paenibacillus sp. MMO-58 TaxID=3081290 RepID=UPI0030166667